MEVNFFFVCMSCVRYQCAFIFRQWEWQNLTKLLFCIHNKYNETGLERPLHWPYKYGLSRQVYFHDRFSCIAMREPLPWKYGCGPSKQVVIWQWSLKTGFTVYVPIDMVPSISSIFCHVSHTFKMLINAFADDKVLAFHYTGSMTVFRMQTPSQVFSFDPVIAITLSQCHLKFNLQNIWMSIFHIVFHVHVILSIRFV